VDHGPELVDPERPAAAALAFHHEIGNAVAANQKLPQYQSGGYRIYPVVGTAQQTNLSARLGGNKVTMLPTYKGDALGGDGDAGAEAPVAARRAELDARDRLRRERRVDRRPHRHERLAAVKAAARRFAVAFGQP
jgi:hypothetical protein